MSMNTDPDIYHTIKPFTLTQENPNDVRAPTGRMQPEIDYNQNQLELEREENRKKSVTDEIKRQQKIRTEEMIKKQHSNKNKEDRIQKIREIREKQQEKGELHTIEEVYNFNNDEEWLYKDKNTYYKVGKFIKKHNFNNSGVYYPNNDGFYHYSRHLVFYEFKKATFLETELIGRFFVENKPGRNRYITNFPENTFNGRNIDLTHKTDYVTDAKQRMRTAIKNYINDKYMLNRNIGQSIPSSTRGYAGDEDENYSDNFWTSQIEEYINFYKQIIPMVQRKLEETTGNGRIDNAVNYLERLEASVKKIVGTKFELEKYMTGEYIDTITQVLSPVATAEIRPPASAATVIPTAAASAASAAPESVFSSWGNYVPGFVSTAASSIGNAASDAASKLKDTARHLGSSGANALRFGTGFPQDSKGMMFAKGASSPPPAKPYLPPHSTHVEPVHMDMNYRQSERNEFFNNPHYHGSHEFVPKSNGDLWKDAERTTGERKAAAAAANEKPWFGGKRKSKRKQRRSRKQKKSRKQRR